MVPRDNLCGDGKCVVCVLLQLDKVPLNVHGSFGHTAVIIYFCVDNYGSQLWQKVFVLYCKNTSYHVKFCSEPETVNKKLILSMPLHLFRMVQITVYIIIMLKPYLSEKKVWNYLRRRSRHWFGKTGWVSGTKQGTQSSLWTFVRHHCFMEYIY